MTWTGFRAQVINNCTLYGRSTKSDTDNKTDTYGFHNTRYETKPKDWGSSHSVGIRPSAAACNLQSFYYSYVSRSRLYKTTELQYLVFQVTIKWICLFSLIYDTVAYCSLKSPGSHSFPPFTVHPSATTQMQKRLGPVNMWSLWFFVVSHKDLSCACHRCLFMM